MDGFAQDGGGGGVEGGGGDPLPDRSNWLTAAVYALNPQ